MRPSEPIRSLLRGRVTGSQLHRQSMARELCAFGFCQQVHNSGAQPASGGLRTWHSRALARIHPLDADDEPVCQLRRPGRLRRCAATRTAALAPGSRCAGARAALRRRGCSRCAPSWRAPTNKHQIQQPRRISAPQLVRAHSKTRHAAVDAPGTREARSRAPPAGNQTPSPTFQLNPAAEPPARRPADRVRRRQARLRALPPRAHPKQAAGRRKGSWCSLRSCSCGLRGQRQARVA